MLSQTSVNPQKNLANAKEGNQISQVFYEIPKFLCKTDQSDIPDLLSQPIGFNFTI